MKYQIGYGKGIVEFNIDEKNLLCELLPNKVDIGLKGADEVKRAIENPIGAERLKDIVKPGERVAIITSDITRPMPSKAVLPAVIGELKLGGIEEKDITIVLAIGSHREHTEDERKYLVGEDVYSKVKCIDSDPDNCINMGTCKNGTPVDIFKVVAEADRRICLGNIEYHYFAGYSGGAKAIMPGVSTRAAIQANHSNMADPRAKAGSMDDNPVRQDIDEIEEYVHIDFILNVVLDSKKNIIKVVAGHYIKAHRQGCAFLDSMYKIKIKEKADIVVVTPGGFPKDINLYQAQKALDNAKHAVKDGGIIVLIASCNEGFGEKVFERWMREFKKPEDMIAQVKDKFELGGHKAAAIGMVLQNARIFLVSDLEPKLVRDIFMEPFDSVQNAVDEAIKVLGPDSKIILMPIGGSTLPFKTEN
ncbi:MAG: nickel-dependent lactate racemase [Clostridiaceae bacterium]|nr:nickel-dependent lactate racemase [Clostridiaceae bacterium]